MQPYVVHIIETGVANIRSLQATFSRLGCNWKMTSDPATVADAEFLVLPGVGTFSAAMESLVAKSLSDPIVERIANDKPTLAICLGLQLLCESSEESDGVQGLGILPNRIKRFSQQVQVPQLGWNRVVPRSPSMEAGDAYFANSFRLADEPLGWNYSKTDYDGEFYSAFWKSNVLACQFHPELSGDWGQRLIANWLEKKLC
jgi:imidazole glycerol phosphate synthase glutamine amidotransferase subunit